MTLDAFYEAVIENKSIRWTSTDIRDHQLAEEKEVAELLKLTEASPIEEVVGRLSDERLVEFQSALSTFITLSDADIGLEFAKAVYDEMEHRQTVNDVATARYGAAVYIHRDWKELQRLRSATGNNQLRRVPELISTDDKFSRPVWTMNASGDKVLIREFEWEDFTGLIFVGSSGCGFSNRAIQDLKSDSVVAEMFSKHAIAMSPPYEQFPNSNDQRWSQELFSTPILQVADRGDWPELPRWSTPNFYFIKNGEVVHWVRGWPSGREQEQIESLREGFSFLSLDASDD